MSILEQSGKHMRAAALGAFALAGTTFPAAADNVTSINVQGTEIPVNCEQAVSNGALTKEFTAWVDYSFYHGGNRAGSPIWVLTRPQNERDGRIAQLPSGPRKENQDRARQMDLLNSVEQQTYLHNTLKGMHDSSAQILDGVLADCSR